MEECPIKTTLQYLLTMAVMIGSFVLLLFAAAGEFGEAQLHPSRKSGDMQIVTERTIEDMGHGYGRWQRLAERKEGR